MVLSGPKLLDLNDELIDSLNQYHGSTDEGSRGCLHH